MPTDSPNTPPAMKRVNLYPQGSGRNVLARVDVPLGVQLLVWRGEYYASKWDDFYGVGVPWVVEEDERSTD